MPNMFKCALAGGGDGASLIVTCTQNFAGSTITLTNGTKTYTQVCPLSSPYEVTFESVATGVWTVSGIAQGQTFSTSVTITDFEALLADIPEGSTATPTNDIQIWLHCANIWDKSYTTISQVLADGTTVTALITSNNAVDYMARSTSWANSVTANASAMTKIGANDYCANKLLANSTWLNAICNSTYFESVLNVKVPTMTSNTTPSGTVSRSAVYDSASEGWKAFDGSDSTHWSVGSAATIGSWIQYAFANAVSVKKMGIYPFYSENSYVKDVVIKGSNDGSNFTTIGNITVANSNSLQYFNITNTTKYKYYRIEATSNKYGSGSTGFAINMLQFYGRA